MTTPTRRLAAILAADVAGYSTAMERDEEGTAAAVRALRRDVIEPKLAEHHGRLIKTTGDGFLAEFASPIAALNCALAIQQRPDESSGLRLRIGLNLGDVIIEESGDLLGEGVNIAARLEGLAEPGGILVSDKIVREVEGKVEASFEDRGEQQVKNITKPVRAYAVRTDAQASATAFAPGKPLPLPDKPSIAVLPFQNMSGDPEQEYFADGMVEDIITGLSRKKGLFVIARNSSFFYKGRQFDVRQVAKELGVRYVLEGSVRKSGDKVRVTGQLIEGVAGTHLWANRFDGDLIDIFDLQDRITSDIVSAISPEIQQAEINRSRSKPTSDLTAYDRFLRGLAAHHILPITEAVTLEARRHWKEAIRIDPAFASPFAYLAQSTTRLTLNGWTNDLERASAEAVEAARMALSLDRSDPDVLIRAGWAIGSLGRLPEEGILLIDEGLSLDNNHALGWAWSASMSNRLGDHRLALEKARSAQRLSPRDVQRHVIFATLAIAYFFCGDYEQAATFSEEAIKLEHGQLFQRRLAMASHALAGRPELARNALHQLLSVDPTASVSKFARLAPYRRPEDQEIMNRGMRLAGLPE